MTNRYINIPRIPSTAHGIRHTAHHTTPNRTRADVPYLLAQLCVFGVMLVATGAFYVRSESYCHIYIYIYIYSSSNLAATLTPDLAMIHLLH